MLILPQCTSCLVVCSAILEKLLGANKVFIWGHVVV